MKISPKKYAQALVLALDEGGNPEEKIRSFLAVVRARGEFRKLPKIVMAFENLWSEKYGILNLSVLYPTKFESSVELLKTALSSLGKSSRIKTKPSDSLIGGYKIKMGETLIDNSIESKLNSLTDKF